MSERVQAPTVVPYNRPLIGEEEIAEVTEVLRSGWLTTGAKCKLFEDEFASYVGARNALAVNSCTAGLMLCLRANDIGPGDEVIVPTLTFAATANVVLQLGAKPILVDVDSDGLISPEAIERARSPRTAAIMPVHYAGQAAELDTLRMIAGDNGWAMIEDAAHAPGCDYHGEKIGKEGTAVFSFYVTKNMTTGEGGMIVTDDDEIVPRLRRLSLHGISHDAWSRYAEGTWAYEVTEAGYKANMTDVQAAMGIHQLRKLDGFMSRRRDIAAEYDRAFADSDMVLPRDLEGRPHGYHIYPVGLPPRVDRTKFITAMKNAGVGTSVHFIPLHRHPLFEEHWDRRTFPSAERIYARLVSLPLYPAMSDDQVDYVIAQTRAVTSVLTVGLS